MTLRELGFDPEHWADALDLAREQFGVVEVGRVAADFGVEQRVLGAFGDERAVLTGKLRFEHGLRPAVGDFVLLTGEPSSFVIVDILPRRTSLARQAAGTKTQMQTIAANLDRVFVVTSFNEDFNFNRLERYLTAIHDGGATGVVVLNKADLVGGEERREHVALLRARLGDDVTIVSSCALGEQDGLAELMPHLRDGETSSFVGSSGVGKSTLVNSLLGEARQVTADVRESDARGRHTTTHREMFLLPGGAIVIDTPGMREFQLWDEGGGLAAFGDIEELGATCRFRDCSHESEPGCAVVAAVDRGELSEARLESWRRLQREVAFQQIRTDTAARREQGKRFSRVVKEIKRND